MKDVLKKSITCLLVTVLLCNVAPMWYALAAPQVINEENLLTNGDFEMGDTTGWIRNGAIEIVPSAAKDGRYGAHITSGNGQWDEYQGLYTDLDVEKNTDYVFSFDHKSDISACVIVYIKSLTLGTDLQASWPTQVPGCWSRQEYHFNSGETDRIRIQLCVGAKNSVRCFDNIRLRRVVKNAISGGLGSVMDTKDDCKGLAFCFDVAAKVQAKAPYTFVSGTVDPYGVGVDYPLVRMGAVVTNETIATEDLTLEAVNGTTCVDVTANKVFDVTADKVSYAVRVTNVPDWADDVTITARPYYIYKDGGEEHVLYGSAAYSESCNSITARNETAVFTPGDGWELVWNDEFGGTTVDDTKWYGETSLSEGNYYFTNREENVSVKDGNMVLTARKEPIGSARFTGSLVKTAHHFSFLYGRLEFRAKLPWGKGVSPALWTMGDYSLYNTIGNGWPYGGEIDIMELVGGSNTDPTEWGNRTTTHNIHWGYDHDNHYEVGSGKLSAYNNDCVFAIDELPSEGYHIYAVEWDYREFKFFVDGALLKQIRWGTDPDGRDYLAWYDGNGNPLGKVYRLPAYDDYGRYKMTNVSCADLDFAFANEENPHYLIMNMAMCGWNANQATNGGNLPQSMYVDYVRVYQKVKD